MKTLLVRFGLWLAGLGGWALPPPCDHTHVLPLSPELRRLIQAAEHMVKHVDRLDAGGEYKRHLVYARMLKAHSGASKRDIALAIEVALR